MDAPIVELPCSFRESVERCQWPQEYTLQPDGKRLDGLSRSAGLNIYLDDVGGVAWTVIFGEAGHCALLQLFDPFDFSLEAIADVDSEARVFGIEDVSFGATLEGVGVSFDQIFKSVDPGVELSYFGGVVILSLFNSFEEGFGDPLQGVGVEVSATIEDVSGGSG